MNKGKGIRLAISLAATIVAGGGVLIYQFGFNKDKEQDTSTNMSARDSLLECADCHQEDWSRLMHFFQTDPTPTQNINDQTQSSLPQTYTPISNPDYNQVNTIYKDWRNKWQTRLNEGDNVWQCIMNIQLKLLNQHFPKIVPGPKTETLSPECTEMQTNGQIQTIVHKFHEDEDDDERE